MSQVPGSGHVLPASWESLAGFRAALEGRRSRLAKGLSMLPLILFGASVAFGLIAWTIVAVRYMWPYLRARPRAEALRPLPCCTASASSGFPS